MHQQSITLIICTDTLCKVRCGATPGTKDRIYITLTDAIYLVNFNRPKQILGLTITFIMTNMSCNINIRLQSVINFCM